MERARRPRCGADLEHQGDKILHEMEEEEALARTFVHPIDREDMNSLSPRSTTFSIHHGAARAVHPVFGSRAADRKR